MISAARVFISLSGSDLHGPSGRRNAVSLAPTDLALMLLLGDGIPSNNPSCPPSRSAHCDFFIEQDALFFVILNGMQIHEAPFHAKGGYIDNEVNQFSFNPSRAFIASQQRILQTMDSGPREGGVSSGRDIFTSGGHV